MQTRLAAIIAGMLAVTSTSEALDVEMYDLFSKAVVRTVVNGTLTTDNPCKLRGTGFFVDKKGHILTAGHNVLPCSEGGLGPAQWKSRPDIQVEMYRPGTGDSNIKAVDAVLIYADTQTDLALLRANVTGTQPLPLAQPGTLRTGASVSVMTFEVDQAQPSDKPVKIESLFNPNKHHDGLIDISGPDIKRSASGGPLFDESSYVAGVFTKGKRETGEAVVPIPFAFSLLRMCGISYPSDEVREVIEELRKDIVAESLTYDKSTDNVTFTYKKRLKAGLSPSRFTAKFKVYTATGVLASKFGLSYEDSVSTSPIQGKLGRVVFENIGSKIDNEIKIYNEHVVANHDKGQKLRDKKYAEVTIKAEFVDGYSLFPLRDYELEF